MVVYGILFGLLAAGSQSFCYVFSRLFITRPGNRSLQLFALSHVWMGLFAVVLLPFCWTPEVWNVRSYALELAGSVGLYMVAQACLFQAVKRTDASRVAPLLGLKILVISLITVVIFRNAITPLQWGAVFLSVFAAVALNHAGGMIPRSGMLAVLGACFGYSVSDLCIVALVKVLSPDGAFRGILLGCCLSYVVAGIIGLALAGLGGRGGRTSAQWRAALPVAITWFVAMVCLYASFRFLGAVFGNIVQSTRGPLSIFLGMAIAAHGHEGLEKRVSPWILARRLSAAVLMCAAIGIFAYERDRVATQAESPPPPQARPTYPK